VKKSISDDNPFASCDEAFQWAFYYFLAHYRWGIANWLVGIVAVLSACFLGATLAVMSPDTSPAATQSSLRCACVLGILACVALFFRRQLGRKADSFACEVVAAYVNDPITPAHVKREFQLHTTLEKIIRPPRPKL